MVDYNSEIYDPVSKKSCILPRGEGKDLPFVFARTFDPPLVCGGRRRYKNETTASSCYKFNFASGSWTKSHNLRFARYAHISWTPASGDGTYLMGGAYSRKTTEIVNIEGLSRKGFNLKYDIR